MTDPLLTPNQGCTGHIIRLLQFQQIQNRGRNVPQDAIGKAPIGFFPGDINKRHQVSRVSRMRLARIVIEHLVRVAVIGRNQSRPTGADSRLDHLPDTLINRLDRETSGVVLVAKNHELARVFGMAMQERRIHKTYVALVHGWPEWKEKIVDAPILSAREVEPSDIWVKQIVHEQGVPCRTEFRALKRFERDGMPLALIEAKPETGRMHQIRVHLHHLGLPIVGDKLYGRDDRCYLEFIETGWTPVLEKKLLLPRQALHSSRLELNLEGFPSFWEAPLPSEFVL